MRAREDLQRTLADIAARDGELKSFVAVHDAAGAQRELDRALAHGGALQGLAVGVKDIFDTATLPAQYGSELFAGRTAFFGRNALHTSSFVSRYGPPIRSTQ